MFYFQQPRKTREVATKPARVSHLRNETDIRQRRTIAKTKAVVREPASMDSSRAPNPSSIQCRAQALTSSSEWLSVFLRCARTRRFESGHFCRAIRSAHAPNRCAIGGIGRQQWRLGKALVQVLDDRQRFVEQPPAIVQRGYESLWINRFVRSSELLAAASPQMNRNLFVCDSF